MVSFQIKIVSRAYYVILILTLFKSVKTTLCGYSRSETRTPPRESDLTNTWQTYSAKVTMHKQINTGRKIKESYDFKIYLSVT